jgi:2-aminoadipate transaminase
MGEKIMEYKISGKMINIKPSAIREIFKSLQDPSVIAFAAGNPSPDAFPVDEIKNLSNLIYDQMPVLALQYGITEGYAPLIEKIQARLKAKFNINADPNANTTLITTGGQQGIDLTCKVMCSEGDIVICEKPSFIGALNAFKANGAKLIGIDMEDDGINIEMLEKALSENKNVKLIYLIPTFHNPLGTTMTLEKRKAVYALAHKYQTLILEDNPYGELRFRGEELPVIKSLDTDGLVVYCSSFSKVLSPAARIGFICAPPSVATKIVVAKQVNDVHTNMYFQLVCNLFLEKYDFEAHIQKIKELYKSKCLLMLGEIEKKFDKSVKYTSPDGGLFLWCTLPGHMDLGGFVREAINRKVAVVPGGAFLIDENEKTTAFRLNYSFPSPAQITDGIGILADVIKQMI